MTRCYSMFSIPTLEFSFLDKLCSLQFLAVVVVLPQARRRKEQCAASSLHDHQATTSNLKYCTFKSPSPQTHRKELIDIRTETLVQLLINNLGFQNNNPLARTRKHPLFNLKDLLIIENQLHSLFRNETISYHQSSTSIHSLTDQFSYSTEPNYNYRHFNGLESILDGTEPPQ